ncbi:MAG: IS607 family transposase [Thermodesulfovibrionales bacterium]
MPPSSQWKTATYVRVSLEGDRDRQVVGKTEMGSGQYGHVIGHVVTEIGSGLNGHRPKPMKLLWNPQYTTLIAEHKEWLMRFGAEYVKSALAAQGRQLLVADPPERNSELGENMIAVLTSFYARPYGKRSTKKKAKRIVRYLT